MSAFGYNLGPPDEQIYVYQQPTRPSWGDLFAGTSAPTTPLPAEESNSWTDRLQRKLNKLQGNKDITEPMYWVYLFIAFALLALVLVGFYWILQTARVAVLKKQIMTRQAIAAAVASANTPMPPSPRRAPPRLTYSGPPSPSSKLNSNLTNINTSGGNSNGYGNVLGLSSIDNSGKNPEICRTGTCPGALGTGSMVGGGSLVDNSAAPRLTYSASAGLAPITLGSTIHGGLGRDICIGCKCIGCDTPGKCSNVFGATLGVPSLPPTSMAAQCGSGYSRDPYLT